MALPPQAIEKLIREPGRTQGAYRELLLFSGAIFALTVVVSAGLSFGYTPYLEGQLASVEKQIQNFDPGVSQEDRTQIQGFYSQLVNLRTLLSNHTAASPVLAMLERTVQPDVYYTKFTMNVATNQAVVNGAAKSLDSAAAQAKVLEGQPEVDHLDFNNAGSQSGGPWQFTMTIYLKPAVFRGLIAAPQPAAPAGLAPLSATGTVPSAPATSTAQNNPSTP